MRQEATVTSVMKWLRLNIGRAPLAALTGTDTRALGAAIHIIELYVRSGDDDLLDALRVVVLKMQPKCYHIVYHVPAYFQEWETRDRVWVHAGLPIDALAPCSVCQGEPGGRALVQS